MSERCFWRVYWVELEKRCTHLSIQGPPDSLFKHNQYQILCCASLHCSIVYATLLFPKILSMFRYVTEWIHAIPTYLMNKFWISLDVIPN